MGPSKENKQYMEMVKNTMKLMDGHYSSALPLRKKGIEHAIQPEASRAMWPMAEEEVPGGRFISYPYVGKVPFEKVTGHTRGKVW